MRKKKRKDQTIRSAPSNRKGRPPTKKKERKKRVAKKAVKSRVDKPRNGGKWSEAMFWQSIRSALRNKTRFWVPKMKAKEAARRTSQSENKRLKWEFQCSICSGWHPESQIEVHHEVPAGSLKCADDLAGFVDRLFAETGWKITCKTCHKQYHDNEKLKK